MNRPTRPRPPEIRHNALGVEGRCDRRFHLSPIEEHLVDLAHHPYLLRRPWNQDDPIRLQALLLTHFKHGLLLTGLVHEHPA